MSVRPPYKSHPLWNEAMELAREAYALAGQISDPGVSSSLRKAAVSVPARIAGALSTEETERDEHVLAARGALAEVSRQAARDRDGQGSAGPSFRRLAERADALERALLFELGVSAGRAFS